MIKSFTPGNLVLFSLIFATSINTFANGQCTQLFAYSPGKNGSFSTSEIPSSVNSFFERTAGASSRIGATDQRSLGIFQFLKKKLDGSISSFVGKILGSTNEKLTVMASPIFINNSVVYHGKTFSPSIRFEINRSDLEFENLLVDGEYFPESSARNMPGEWIGRRSSFFRQLKVGSIIQFNRFSSDFPGDGNIGKVFVVQILEIFDNSGGPIARVQPLFYLGRSVGDNLRLGDPGEFNLEFLSKDTVNMVLLKP